MMCYISTRSFLTLTVQVYGSKCGGHGGWGKGVDPWTSRESKETQSKAKLLVSTLAYDLRGCFRLNLILTPRRKQKL